MVIEHIEEQLPGAVTERHDFRGDQTILVPKERFLEVVDLIYREGFQMLVDLTAVDWPQRAQATEGGESGVGRFDVVYHWLNLANVLIDCRLSEICLSNYVAESNTGFDN